MDRGDQNAMARRLDMPWIWVQYTMLRGFIIP
jgi:hypothetical protein